MQNKIALKLEWIGFCLRFSIDFFVFVAIKGDFKHLLFTNKIILTKITFINPSIEKKKILNSAKLLKGLFLILCF